MRARFVAASLACFFSVSSALGVEYSNRWLAEQATAETGDCEPGVCDACDASPCDFSDCCNCGPRLFGFLESDHCFDSFISPLSNPFFFEDPRSLTEARGIFIDNYLPNQISGSELQVWAGQLRGRLTERTSVIAPRLGYVSVHPGGGDSPAGFLSAPIGLKYNLIRDVENQFLVSVGATYFIPGQDRAYSGFGDGDFHFFASAGKQIFDRGHWISGTGFRIAGDNNWGTQMWYWSNQWDYELPGHWYPLAGVNWFHYMSSSGLNATNGIGGLDIINLPTYGVAGTNVATGVAGLKWKPTGHFEVGGGYEFPLTNRTDILADRIYFDMIFRY